MPDPTWEAPSESSDGGAVRQVLVAPPPPTWDARPLTPRGSRMATASLVLGIVAMILNVLLVPTVLAIVFGAIALGRGTAARARAVVGIVLGGVGVFALLVQIAVLIPVVAVLTHVPFHERMAAWIEQDVNAREGVALSDVECPVAGELFVGKRITCTAREGAEPILIDVTFTTDTGAYEYLIESTPAG